MPSRTSRARRQLSLSPPRPRRDERAGQIRSAAEASLAAALSRMAEERISSLFVRFDTRASSRRRRAETGIVTERDVMRALATSGADALQTAGRAVHERAAPGHRAGRRVRFLRHRPHEPAAASGIWASRTRRAASIGALSARDLLRLRADEARSRSATRSIRQRTCTRSPGRGPSCRRSRRASLGRRTVGPRDRGPDLARARGIDAARRRAGRAAHARGGPRRARRAPMRVAVLGSAGRGESLLAMDQDNALIFAEGEPGGREDRWFAALGAHVADILHEVGVPYCKGGVMAKNPQWRGSVRDLAPAHRRVDRALEARRTCCRSTSSSTCAACTATPALQTGSGGKPSMPPRGQIAFAKLLAESAGTTETGLDFPGRLPHRARVASI